MKYSTLTAVTMLAAALAGCGGDADAPPSVQDQPAGGMQPVPSMPGMGGMQMDDPMIEEMRAHMQTLEGAGARQLAEDLPEHRQLVANMISRMNREMREMEMPADEEWNGLLEELRQDLRLMPEMDPAELEGYMSEHRARVTRLMECTRG